MVDLQRIDSDSILPVALKPFEAMVAKLGSERFYRTFSGCLEAGVAVDRLYLIEGSARTQPLIAETEPGKPTVPGATYVTQFLPSDPLQTAIDAIRDEDSVLRLRVQPRDIVVAAYRGMLERAGVVERVSFVRKLGRHGWRCMTVVRRDVSGPFSEQEMLWLGSFYRLLSPLIDRHRVLVGEVVENRSNRIAELEQRFAQRHPSLTLRERQICARAAIGISVEGCALDLGIGPSSVLTYRRRAYRRLGVSGPYELATLVLR